MRLPARLRLPLAVYAVCQVVLLLWWAAFYPGAMSYDSVAYVWHVTTGHWMANHSVPYDGLVWLSLKGTGTLATLTFLQVVLWAVALAYAADVLHDLGVRARWAALAAFVAVAIPSLGQFPSFVWKDVPFTISAVVVFAATGRIVARRLAGEAPPARAFWLIGAGFLGLVLFRNNGFLTALVAVPVLVIALRRYWARLLALTLVPIAFSFVLTSLVYPALKIEAAQPSLTYASAYADIAVTYHDRPETFTARDRAVMAEVAPLWFWDQAGTSCYSSDWLTNRPRFDKTVADGRTDELLALWGRTLRRTPDAAIGARVCRGSIAWRIWPGPRELDGHTIVGEGGVTPDRFGWAAPGGRMEGNPYLADLRTRPLLQPERDAMVFVLRASRMEQLEFLLWRAPIWCYAGIAAIALYARRRRSPAALALTAMIVAGQLSVLAANPAQLFRYMPGPMLIGVLAVPLAFAGARRAASRTGPPPAAREPQEEPPAPEPEPEPEPEPAQEPAGATAQGDREP
ncbi:DUF6020 family protein [Actinomadura parmotrematis]|uniref:Glycosyltransferase RgtA/B/C/D-like domain-containing protein n=1 Tax=Actinomadura parmotrematis TaxID=2864039 RepID=A0ABS7FY84_9ACTN|nr:DUF6020 family protein [Actinomadura parmotrematis]MBW8484629.1 hypothetical protein [Actinomadura parmotrematis]